MRDYDWKPYVPVAVRRAQAEKVAAKASKGGAALTPVRAGGNKIATTFWGRAWCDNLERYSDFSNRLPRGRTYLRNGSVIDLKIESGEVRAQVAGSRLYKTAVKVAAVPKGQWQAIGADCAGSIDSLVELLRGKLSQAVMARICKPGTGLFPAPKEISFDCSCPDWASMCKHVAAVLYGVGVRLDQQPELLFCLRGVDAADLVADAGLGLKTRQKRPAGARVLEDAQLADVFGIEIAGAPVRPLAASPRANIPATTARKKATTTAITAKPGARPPSGKSAPKRNQKAPTPKTQAVVARKVVARTAAPTPSGTAVKRASSASKKVNNR